MGFQYNRLVFGITSASAIWQRTGMIKYWNEHQVQVCIFDDMIITGKDDEENL